MSKPPKQNNMKIEHTSFDEVRKGRPSGQPLPPSSPFSYQNTRASAASTSRSRQEKSFADERPITVWPSFLLQQPDPPPSMTNYLTQKERLGTQKKRLDSQKGRLAISKTQSSDRRSPAQPVPNKTAYLTQTERREMERRARKQDEASQKAQSSDRTPLSQSTPNKPTRRPTPPPLGSKPKFSDSVREFLGSPKTSRHEIIPEQKIRHPTTDDLTKAQELRERIRDGKMEKVIPPGSRLPDGRPTSSRSREPALQPNSSRSSHGKKSSSPAGAFGKFIDTGAELLHEAGKGLVGKLSPSLERPSFSSTGTSGKKTRRGSNASDLSFKCTGETAGTKHDETYVRDAQASKEDQVYLNTPGREVRASKEGRQKSKPPIRDVPTPPGRQQNPDTPSRELQPLPNERQLDSNPPTREAPTSKERPHSSQRLSGEGTDPWTSPQPATCQLCGQAGVSGVRGLCNDCETKSRPTRPISPLSEWTSQVSSSESDWYDEDIKPTPPLKDPEYLSKTAYVKEVSPKREPVAPPRPDKHRLENWVKSQLRDTSPDRTPRIISPLTRHQSQRAEMVGEVEREKFRDWQTEELRAEYDHLQGLIKGFDIDDELAQLGKDTNPSNGLDVILFDEQEQNQPTIAEGRDAAFYGFYDDLLSDYGKAKLRKMTEK